MSRSSLLPRRTRRIAVGCLGLLALFTGSSAAAAPKVLTLVEPEKGSTFAFVDNAPKTKLVHGEPRVISPGDQMVFSRSIQEGGTNVGRAEVSCVATHRSKRIDKAGLICHGIYVLQAGILTSSTVVTSTGAEGAITGGTGLYASARGTLLGTIAPGASTTVITLAG